VIAGVVDNARSLLHRNIKDDLALFQRVHAHGAAGGSESAEHRNIVA
jgi:hypothetical protein